MNGKSPLTFAGRILAVITFLMAVVGTWAYIDWIWDQMSPGRHPIWLFAMPVVLCALTFFGLGVVVLKYLGVAVFNERRDANDSGGD